MSLVHCYASATPNRASPALLGAAWPSLFCSGQPEYRAANPVISGQPVLPPKPV